MNASLESDNEFDSDSENYLSSTNDKEHNLNANRGRKPMRLLTESEDDSQESNERQYIEIAVDGTIWKKMEKNSSPGRSPFHMCVVMGKIATIFAFW